MKQRGFIPILIVIALVGLILFTPIPYYQKQDTYCESTPPKLCISKGWHFKTSLLQEILGLPKQTVSHSLPATKDQIACTQDAKLCPDGTYVSRVGPKCDFTPCPTMKESTPSAETANWKTYTCPKSEYIDCMPKIGATPPSPNPLCSQDYLNWAKANCPNFKGATY